MTKQPVQFSRTAGPRQWLRVALATTLAAGIAGSVAVTALARGGHGGPFGGSHGHLSPEDRASFIELGTQWVLRDLEATPEQQQRIESIALAALGSLDAAHEQVGALHDSFAQLARAEVIDRAAIESLRAEHVAWLDARSRELSGALADVLEVLTPRQRTALLERMEQHAH